MKAVLISIKPKLCTLIANGEKTIEVRKTRPKIETPFKCYIYATKQGRPLVYGSPVPTYVDENLVQTYGYSKEEAERIFGIWNGKVIGEFVCDDIENMYENIISGKGNEHIKKGGCLSGKDLNFYAKGKIIFAWNISNLKIYDEPKEIWEFRKQILPKGLRYEDDIIKRAPQSWCYVEEFL